MTLIILRGQCSYGTHDVDHRTLGNSSQRSPILARDMFNPHDGPPLTFVPRRVHVSFCAIQSSHLTSPKFITQPGSRIAFQFAQFADHPECLWAARSDRPTVGSQEQIREFQRIFDEAHFAIDLLDPGRGLPSALLMAPIVRVEQGWAVPLVK